MRRLRLLAIGTAALAVSGVALGAASAKTVTVTGKVQAVSTVSVKVAGTFCVFAPSNSRMMMPAIIRELAVGDTATMTCVRSAGRLVVAKIVERPAGAVVVRGTVNATTNQSITVRGVTCAFTATNPPNPRMQMPTIIRGSQVLMACLRGGGQHALTAATELQPHPGRVVLLSGNVEAVSRGSITVNGVTCAITGTRKPLPEMPTWIKGVDAGDAVTLACTAASGHLVATGVAER